MNRQPFFSIILPVYNGAAHLESCLNSLFDAAARLPDAPQRVQFVIIDDGSTDATPHLLNQLCGSRNDCVLLHQANSGVSAARNLGLAHAQGAYVAFVDADDVVSPDYFRVLFDALAAETVDILEFNGNYFNDGTPPEHGGSVYPPYPYPLQCADDYRNKLSYQALYYTCFRVYAAPLLRNIRFAQGIQICEDALFNSECYAVAQSIRSLPARLYRYRQSPNSLSHADDAHKAAQLLQLLVLIEQHPTLPADQACALSANIVHRRKSLMTGYRLAPDEHTAYHIHRLRRQLRRPADWKTRLHPARLYSLYFPALTNLLIVLKRKLRSLRPTRR